MVSGEFLGAGLLLIARFICNATIHVIMFDRLAMKSCCFVCR